VIDLAFLFPHTPFQSCLVNICGVLEKSKDIEKLVLLVTEINK